MTQTDTSPPPFLSAGGFRAVFLCLAIVALTFAIRLPLLKIPLERDEGEYAYIAWRMDFHELPYRDWVDQKPPGVFWAYRWALTLPLDSVQAIHLAGAFFAAASAGALFVLARRFLATFWAIVAALLLGLLSADPTIQGTAANTELFMQLPIILSCWAFLVAAAGGRGRFVFTILCGVFAGLATLFKQVAALHYLFLVIAYPLFCGEEKWRHKLFVFVAGSALGIVAVWAPVLAYFRMKHAWHDFVYDVFLHNFGYIAALPSAQRWTNLRGALIHLFQSQVIIWLFALIGGVSLLQRRQRKWFLFFFLWMTTSAVGVNLSGYFFPHYFQSLLPVLSLAAAFGASTLADAAGWTLLSLWVRRAAVISALALLPFIAIIPYLFRYSPEEAANRIYPGNPFAQMPELGRRLAAITQAGDRVFIFGSEPELLFYAQRPSATRYIFLFPLFGPYADARERQMATALEIAAAQPAAAFYVPSDLFDLPGAEPYLATWSFDYLRRNFQRDQWLVADANGSFRVQPAVTGPLPSAGVAGELLVRRRVP